MNIVSLPWIVAISLGFLQGFQAVAQTPPPPAPNPPVNPSSTPTNPPPKMVKESDPDGGLWISGPAKVIDAHTIVFVDGTEVELNGLMDAPDLDQEAMLGEDVYPCGKIAAEFLRTLISGQTVTFLSFGGKGRPRGNCYAGETFVQEAMVRYGWAVSDHSATELAQRIAQQNKRGLWRGPFVPPKRWRKGERLPNAGRAATEATAVAASRVGPRNSALKYPFFPARKV